MGDATPLTQKRQVIIYLHRNGQPVARRTAQKMSVVVGLDAAHNEAAMDAVLNTAGDKLQLKTFAKALFTPQGDKIWEVNELEQDMDVVVVDNSERFLKSGAKRPKSPGRGGTKSKARRPKASAANANPHTELLKHKLRSMSYTSGGQDPKQIFKMADRDKSGALELEEFIQAVRGLGRVHTDMMTDEELEQLFLMIDADRSGAVDIEEITTFVWGEGGPKKGGKSKSPARGGRGGTPPRGQKGGASPAPLLNRPIRQGSAACKEALDRIFKQVSSKKMAREAFARMDRDGSGSLDETEFRRVMVDLGVVLTPRQVQEVIKLVDADGDGDVDAEEFLEELWQRKFARVRSKFQAASYSKGGQDWARLFHHYDRDNSGELDFDEFRRAIRRDVKVTPAMVPDEELQDMFDHADGSGDGAIDIDEFISMMANNAEEAAQQKKAALSKRSPRRGGSGRKSRGTKVRKSRAAASSKPPGTPPPATELSANSLGPWDDASSSSSTAAAPGGLASSTAGIENAAATEMSGRFSYAPSPPTGASAGATGMQQQQSAASATASLPLYAKGLQAELAAIHQISQRCLERAMQSGGSVDRDPVLQRMVLLTAQWQELAMAAQAQLEGTVLQPLQQPPVVAEQAAAPQPSPPTQLVQSASPPPPLASPRVQEAEGRHQANAATTVQSHFRGFKTRLVTSPMRYRPNQQHEEDRAAIRALEQEVASCAATTVQARWRGYKARLDSGTNEGTLRIVIPEGSTPGATLLLTAPDGREMEILVPAGCKPGDEMDVDIGGGGGGDGSSGDNGEGRAPPPLPSTRQG